MDVLHCSLLCPVMVLYQLPSLAWSVEHQDSGQRQINRLWWKQKAVKNWFKHVSYCINSLMIMGEISMAFAISQGTRTSATQCKVCRKIKFSGQTVKEWIIWSLWCNRHISAPLFFNLLSLLLLVWFFLSSFSKVKRLGTEFWILRDVGSSSF